MNSMIDRIKIILSNHEIGNFVQDKVRKQVNSGSIGTGTVPTFRNGFFYLEMLKRAEAAAVGPVQQAP